MAQRGIRSARPDPQAFLAFFDRGLAKGAETQVWIDAKGHAFALVAGKAALSGN